MHTSPTSQAARRELCHRSGDGIEVTLGWLPGDDGLQVAVVDTKLNRCFELPVDPARAMRVFTHPFLYAQDAGVRLPERPAGRSPAWT